MQTIESVYVSFCLIGWCVLSVIALVGLLAILVWAFVTAVKDWRAHHTIFENGQSKEEIL